MCVSFIIMLPRLSHPIAWPHYCHCVRVLSVMQRCTTVHEISYAGENVSWEIRQQKHTSLSLSLISLISLSLSSLSYLSLSLSLPSQLQCTPGMTVQQVIETEIPDISRTGYQVSMWQQPCSKQGKWNQVNCTQDNSFLLNFFWCSEYTAEPL